MADTLDNPMGVSEGVNGIQKKLDEVNTQLEKYNKSLETFKQQRELLSDLPGAEEGINKTIAALDTKISDLQQTKSELKQIINILPLMEKYKFQIVTTRIEEKVGEALLAPKNQTSPKTEDTIQQENNTTQQENNATQQENNATQQENNATQQENNATQQENNARSTERTLGTQEVPKETKQQRERVLTNLLNLNKDLINQRRKETIKKTKNDRGEINYLLGAMHQKSFFGKLFSGDNQEREKDSRNRYSYLLSDANTIIPCLTPKEWSTVSTKLKSLISEGKFTINLYNKILLDKLEFGDWVKDLMNKQDTKSKTNTSTDKTKENLSDAEKKSLQSQLEILLDNFLEEKKQSNRGDNNPQNPRITSSQPEVWEYYDTLKENLQKYFSDDKNLQEKFSELNDHIKSHFATQYTQQKSSPNTDTQLHKNRLDWLALCRKHLPQEIQNNLKSSYNENIGATIEKRENEAQEYEGHLLSLLQKELQQRGPSNLKNAIQKTSKQINSTYSWWDERLQRPARKRAMQKLHDLEEKINDGSAFKRLIQLRRAYINTDGTIGFIGDISIDDNGIFR